MGSRIGRRGYTRPRTGSDPVDMLVELARENADLRERVRALEQSRQVAANVETQVFIGPGGVQTVVFVNVQTGAVLAMWGPA